MERGKKTKEEFRKKKGGTYLERSRLWGRNEEERGKRLKYRVFRSLVLPSKLYRESLMFLVRLFKSKENICTSLPLSYLHEH